MPTLRQLKALSLIAQTGSFTRAAERMFVTQSAVSALVRELEDEVGAALIQRGRVIALTDAGEVLHRAALRAEMEIQRGVMDARSGPAAAQPVVRVAAGSLSAAALMPAAIARLRALSAPIGIVLFDRPVGMLGDMLLSGEADVAIGSVESPQRLSGDLRSTILLEDRIAVVSARNSKIAERAELSGGLTWNDLAREELILIGRTGGQWNLLLQDQLALHEGLRIGHEVQLLSTALELVRANLGVAMLPCFATRHLEAASFCVAPLLQTSASWKTYFVQRKESDHNPKQEAIELLKQALLAHGA